FHDDGGRAHACDGNDERIVIEFFDGQHARRWRFLQRLLEEQAPDVRIAATASAEKRRAAREIVGIGQLDAHAQTPSPASSPMALTRTRTAPPGRYCNGSSSTST